MASTGWHRRGRRLAVAAALLSCLVSSRGAQAQAPATIGQDPELAWHQIMLAPRITSSLRAVAVDPTDAQNVYVATEEGTLAHSTDGGVSWDEIELSPWLIESATVSLGLYGDDYKAIDVFAGLNVSGYFAGANLNRQFQPTGRDGAGQGPGIVGPPPMGLANLFVYPVRFAQNPEPLLGSLAQQELRDPNQALQRSSVGRGGPRENVRDIAVCRGGNFGLLVASGARLFGSSDGGPAFVPIFATRDGSAINSVACSPTGPNEVIVAAGDGTYRSTDGGASFDPMSGDLGDKASSVVTFGPAGEKGKSTLFVAVGGELWKGDPSEADGMRALNLGPEPTGIRDVAVTPQSVWVAMENGVRFSLDAGATWKIADEVESMAWTSIAASQSGGRDHVVVLGENAAFEKTPGSATFRPSFQAQSWKRLRQVVALPDAQVSSPFLLLTLGELWTATSSQLTKGSSDERSTRSAQRRLAKMPSKTAVIGRAFMKAHLSQADIDRLATGFSRRAWLPGVTVSGSFGFESVRTTQIVTITDPVETTTAQSRQPYAMGINFVWELPEVFAPGETFAGYRDNLYHLQAQLSAVVEDAYDERWQVLTRLAAGGLDTEQLLSLESRLAMLDVVLNELAGGDSSSSAD